MTDHTPVGGVPIVPPPPKGRWMRWLVLGVLGVVALVAVYVLVTFVQVRHIGRSDEARPVDAIVVMGAAQYDGRPSPQLAARLDHVVELWGQQLAPLVVVTGGKREGDRFTEAEASARYLEERGVPADAIVLEDQGRNTYDSLAAVRYILGSRGLDRVLIVTDPYHSLRSELTADELGLEAYVSPTRTSPVRGATETRREMKEALGVALGRIIGFRRLLGITG